MNNQAYQSMSRVPIEPNHKVVRAVAPFSFGSSPSFKAGPFNAWTFLGSAPPPGRFLRSLAFRFELPRLHTNRHEARLRFVEPIAIRFDTFPDYLHYEILPMLWGCWPCYRPMVERWLRRHHANCAIFTSVQTANHFRKRLPDINILSVTEGVDTTPYHAGKLLEERKTDQLEYGSIKRNFFRHHVEGISHLNRDIVAHIGDYQQLADRNRETALRLAPWEPRMRKVMEWLRSHGCEC